MSSETQIPDLLPEEPPAEIDEVIPVIQQSEQIVASRSMFVAGPNKMSKEEAEEMAEHKFNVLGVLFADTNAYVIDGLTGDWKVEYIGPFLTDAEFHQFFVEAVEGSITRGGSTEELYREEIEKWGH